MKNKTVLAVVLILVISFAIISSLKTYNTPIQRKLIGLWNIEYEDSYIERDSLYDVIGSIIHFKKDTLLLPSIYDPDGDIDFQGKNALELDDDFFTPELMEQGRKHFEKMRQSGQGSWKMISKNPDSIFFNVPQNPLHGRYAIRFFIDRNGWVYANMRNNIYKMELTNDSTRLICNKGGIMVFPRDLKNWEN